MPAGWWHGRLGAIATLDGISGEVESRLLKVLGGDTGGFVAWIGERTQALVHGYDRETRDADLETVVTLIQAKLRRTLPFHTAEQSALQPPINSDVDIEMNQVSSPKGQSLNKASFPGGQHPQTVYGSTEGPLLFSEEEWNTP